LRSLASISGVIEPDLELKISRLAAPLAVLFGASVAVVNSRSFP